jgi:hypothetical protein
MKKVVFAAALVSAMLLFPLVPAHAGLPTRFIEVTKVVDGDGSTGPYEVEISCEVDDGDTIEVDDGETIVVPIQNQTGDICSVTETVDNDADDVSYECIEGSVGDEAASCDEDNVVSWPGDFTGDAEVIITNTFDPTTTTTTAPSTTTTVRPAAAPVAAVVAATPAFTG